MPRPARTQPAPRAWTHLVTLLHGGEFAAWLATRCLTMPLAAAKKLEEARSYVQAQLKKLQRQDQRRSRQT